MRGHALPIAAPVTGSAAAGPAAPPRAIGRCLVSARRRGDVSVLQDLHQSGSMRVLFPRPASPPTAMLLNTAGGITGGDRFEVSAAAEPGADLTVTTQAAERAYAAMPGPAGRLDTVLRAEAGARLWWLPQETILFDGCALERTATIEIAGDAELLYLEPVVFGRAASGEVLRQGRFHERVRLRRDGRMVYADGIALSGDIAAQMAHPARGAGAGAMATLVLAAPRAEACLAPTREKFAELSGVSAGASLIEPQIMVVRMLADDSFELRRALLPVLDDLTGGTLPICWRL